MSVWTALGHSIMQPMFWFQPLFYAFHGWLATEMALWMLFHPYEAKFVPGTKIQLPFTPGIFPRGHHKLSVSIANTITDILLTQEDIKKQAQKLITEDSIYKTLDMLIDSVGSELRDVTHIRRLYHHLERLTPALAERLLNDALNALEKGDKKQFNQISANLFNRMVPYLTITPEHADFITRMLFTHGITPANLRQILMDALTPETIDFLEETVRKKVGGIQGFLVRFVDIKKSLYDFRLFLLDEPEEAEAFLKDVLDQLDAYEKVKQQVLKFSPQQLPVETLEDLKNYLADTSAQVLITNREEIVQTVCGLTAEATHSITGSLVRIDYNKMAETWLPGFKRDVAHFIYTYLHKELENMLSKALPAISLNTVIVEKIDQFSAKQLEETIQRICHRELRWLAFLGAFLGFWLGLVSNLISYWQPPFHGT